MSNQITLTVNASVAINSAADLGKDGAQKDGFNWVTGIAMILHELVALSSYRGFTGWARACS